MEEEKTNRRFESKVFSGQEIRLIIAVVVKALGRLREIGQAHQRVSLKTVRVREDRSVFLCDPWLFPQESATSLDLTKNNHSYPSP